MTIPVFIGWDSREPVAYDVCAYSIKSRTKRDMDIRPLKLDNMRALGMYRRGEDKLGSTEFTFTRFFVPYLRGYVGWAIFCDCDFLFLDDIERLWDLRDERYAAMVVKHDYTVAETEKMDGKTQTVYPRKNWSSLILWNCSHPAHGQLNMNSLNSAPGQWLHRFQWINDEQLGEIPVGWNWLVDVYQPQPETKIHAVHHTLGGPWFKNYWNCGWNQEWKDEYKRMTTRTWTEQDCVA